MPLLLLLLLSFSSSLSLLPFPIDIGYFPVIDISSYHRDRFHIHTIIININEITTRVLPPSSPIYYYVNVTIVSTMNDIKNNTFTIITSTMVISLIITPISTIIY